MKPTASQVRNHYSPNNQEAHHDRAHAQALMNTANHHCWSNVWTSNPAFEYSIGDLADIQAVIMIWQDDDDTDWVISNDESEDLGESPLSSHIEEDDLDNRQEVLHQGQARLDETIRPTRVPLPKKRSCAHTVIARASLSVGAIAPPLLKRQKSSINISRVSDVGQALPLPKAGGDQNVPQPMASGDQNVPQQQKATFEVPKWLMEAIVFTKTRWAIISDEMYLMVDEAWKLAIGPQNRHRALADAPVGAPSVCQLPGDPSLAIDPQTREAVSVYSVFCSSIGVMMILNLESYIVKTKD